MNVSCVLAASGKTHRDETGKILGQVFGFEDRIVRHNSSPTGLILCLLPCGRKGDAGL
jgi:hypothetical protein